MLVAGVLAGGTVFAGVASAGASTAKPGTAKPGTTKPGTAKPGTFKPGSVNRRASCMNDGPFFFNVTKNSENFYLGTPNNVHSGSAAILKPKKNGSTLWTICFFSTSDTILFENRNLALTSRSTGPGDVVTMTRAGNNGDGFASQKWDFVESGSTLTFQNESTGLFLRIRNNGPKIGQSVTTGFTPEQWIFSM